jgi:hypothetical protein
MLYSSKRDFKLWAFTVSHCSLLIRSAMKYSDEDGFSESTSYNIDIEFWAVEYMNVPSYFNGVKLRQVENDYPREIPFLKSNKSSGKIFEIETNNLKYYVIAGGFIVGKNSWEQEDRIFNYHSNLNHDEVIVSA